MRAAARVRPYQHLLVQVDGDLGEGESPSGDVVLGGVGPGVALTENQHGRLAGTAPAVVDERAQRVEPERLLPGRRGVLFLRVRDEDRRIQIQRDQRATGARCRRTGHCPHLCACCRSRAPDQPQRLRPRLGQRVDQPGDRRIRRHRPEHLR
jgi:hypothetical protein